MTGRQGRRRRGRFAGANYVHRQTVYMEQRNGRYRERETRGDIEPLGDRITYRHNYSPLVDNVRHDREYVFEHADGTQQRYTRPSRVTRHWFVYPISRSTKLRTVVAGASYGFTLANVADVLEGIAVIARKT